MRLLRGHRGRTYTCMAEVPFKLLPSRKNKLENKKTTRGAELYTETRVTPQTTHPARAGAPAFNVAVALKILYGRRYRTTADVTRRELSTILSRWVDKNVRRYH